MSFMIPPASPPEFRETDDRLRLFEKTIDLGALRLDPSRLGQLAARPKEQIFKELLSVVNVLLVLADDADDAKVAVGRSEELENELDAMQNLLVTTKNDYVTMQSELDATQSVLVTTKSDFATLQTEYTTNKNAYAAIRSELTTTRDELGATKSELDATKSGLDAIRSELAATQEELQAFNSKAMPSSRPDMSWTQDLIKQTIEREIAAAKEQLKSPTARTSIDVTRPTLPPKSKSEYKHESRFENADIDYHGSTMGHIVASTNSSSNNGSELISSNAPWSEAMINTAFSSKEPNVLTKKRSASTSRGRSTTIKSLLSSTPAIPTRRSRSTTITTSVPTNKIPPIEDMPSREMRDMASSWDLVAYNQRANENRASKRMTYMPSYDNFASSRTTSTTSLSRNSSDMPWSDRPMSRDTARTISPVIESRHWDVRPMSSRGPSNTNDQVTLYDVPRNQETPRETAIRLATSANKAIVSQMRWQTDCTQGNAKWSYSTTLPDSAMFYSIFGNDKGKKWKQKKVSLHDFRNALGDVEITRFDNRFKVTGEFVKVKWDEKSLTWSMSGTYGI